jgi:hypothetical protein
MQGVSIPQAMMIESPCPSLFSPIPRWYWGCQSAAESQHSAAAAGPTATAAGHAPAPETKPRAPATSAAQPKEVFRGADAASEPVSAPATSVGPDGSSEDASAADPTAPVEVGLQFPGVSAEAFSRHYAASALAAVAHVAGVDPSAVEQSMQPAGGRRRLHQAAGFGSGHGFDSDGVEVTYSITSPNRAVTLERVEAAAANDGAGFIQALVAAGVPLRPAVTVNGAQRTSRPRFVRPSPAAAGAGADSSSKRMPAGVVAGAIIGALLGAALLAALTAFAILTVRARREGCDPPLAALLRRRRAPAAVDAPPVDAEAIKE